MEGNMYFIIALPVILVILLLYEYRTRKPDEIVLKDDAGQIKIRTFRYYPRHFSLVISGTIETTTLEISAEAKGKLPLRVSLAATIAPAPEHIDHLIRVGGWNKNAVTKALKEFEIVLRTAVQESCEKYEIDEIRSEEVAQNLRKKATVVISDFGLDLLTLNVTALEPVDEKLIQAMQQQETARIIETSEKANQDARVNVAKTKITADEKIALAEHDLEMKKIQLKKKVEAEDAQVANQRVRDEIERRKMQLEFDRKEVELLKNNPELVLLTPQIARLAEASQNLRNAKTVVNLSPSDGTQSSQITNLLHVLLQNLSTTVRQSTRKEDSKK
jgi:hypothetical protein